MKVIKVLILAFLVVGCKDKVKESADDIATDAAEIVENPSDGEWEMLFDGKTFNGWHEYLKDNVSDNWKIEDGAMVFYPPKDRPDKETYNLITDNEYKSFVLSMDWKISEGGNSGIFWGVKELPEIKNPYESGPEIQILDNDNHPDGKNGTSHQSGALYDMVSPLNDATKPVGEWNTCIISINHKTNEGSVELNGEKMVDFPLSGTEWKNMISKSKFSDWEHFGIYATGKIGVQDHDNKVAFKNIKIKQL